MSKLIFIVAGARPNFVKIAPLIREFNKNRMEFKLVHTGQHYDYKMSKIFFENLDIPKPDIYLNVGSGTHAFQTASIMIEFEKELIKYSPKLVIVVGDVNSTIACALVAKKMDINVAHVEAGLRSFDKSMPEEINRILTDQISDLLFITEKSAEVNLLREGIKNDRIFFVGNVMIDTLLFNLEKARDLDILRKYNLKEKNFALITLHRPSNVDKFENLEKIIEIINYLNKFIDIFFPIHPRTAKNLERFGLRDKINRNTVILSEPVGYLEFLNLMINSKLILTDSGGIQEEASYLGIPILTLRENTERPITVENGTNTIIGTEINKAQEIINTIFNKEYKKSKNIEKWDGKTSIRIIEILKKYLNET